MDQEEPLESIGLRDRFPQPTFGWQLSILLNGPQIFNSLPKKETRSFKGVKNFNFHFRYSGGYLQTIYGTYENKGETGKKCHYLPGFVVS